MNNCLNDKIIKQNLLPLRCFKIKLKESTSHAAVDKSQQTTLQTDSDDYRSGIFTMLFFSVKTSF